MASLVSAAPKGADLKDYEWWREARFGVFIHWNMSTLLELGNGSWAREDSHKNQGSNSTMKTLPSEIADGSYKKYTGGKRVPQKIYDNLYQIFNPTQFDATKMVATLKAAGANYIVFTTKHHDGFCMFDTKYTDYNIMNTPFARDVAKELSDACAEAGIKVIWYYSNADFHQPLYSVETPLPYQEYLINQIRELFGNYKNIQGSWWDGGGAAVDGRAVREVINQYNPHALTNGRGPKGMPPLTFGTPEQRLGSFDMDRPWETCAIVQGEGWFWNGGKNIKSINTCLRLLIDSAEGDGNLLLDFGPTPEGIIYEPVKAVYLGMGAWLKEHGESIYGTRGGPYTPGHWGGATRKGNTIYLHITQSWPSGVLELPPLPAKVVGIKAIDGGVPTFKQSEESLRIELDKKDHQLPDTVIALELDQPALDLPVIKSPLQESLSKDVEVTASSLQRPKGMYPASVVLSKYETGEIKTHFGEEAKKKGKKKHKLSPELLKKMPWLSRERGHIWRFWMADGSDKQPWIELNLGEPKTFRRISLLEKYSRIKSFELQISEGEGWKTVVVGEELGNQSFELAAPVTAARVRLLITRFESDIPAEGPAIHIFDLFKD